MPGNERLTVSIATDPASADHAARGRFVDEGEIGPRGAGLVHTIVDKTLLGAAR